MRKGSALAPPRRKTPPHRAPYCTVQSTMNAKLQRLFAALLVLGTVLAITAYAPFARAGGVFKLKSSTVDEVSGGWHVFVEIQVARAPSTPHTTMRFLFTKEVVYERALTDNGPDPVINRQVVQNQTPTVESLDVDFSDPRGKIFNRTRFDFTLTRPRGYEAGEYTVKLRTGDGIDVGGTVHLILKGDNPVVDRRSITFSAGKGNIKKVDTGIDAGPQVASNDT